MGKLFRYKLSTVFDFNRSYFLTSDGDMYIGIQIVHKISLLIRVWKDILIAVICCNYFISYMLLYTHKYLDTIKVLVVE